MFWIFLISALCFAAHADPVRICVPQTLSASCSQMEQDLPAVFKCVTAPDTFSCIVKVHQEEADITNVDPSALYLAGHYYNLRPIATELADGETFRYEAIALVRKGSRYQSAEDLKNATSCHTGMGRTAGWQIPVTRLMSGNILPAHCEDGELGAVKDFFGGSCVPGEWSKDPLVDRELKTKYSKLCSRCKNPSTCAKDDAYAGYEGVMECLSEGAAEVGFTKIPSLREYLAKNPAFANEVEILCFDGGRKNVDDPSPCVWGVRPTNSFIARHIDSVEEDTAVDALLQTQARYSSGGGRIRTPEWYYKSFLSHPKVTGLRKTEDDKSHFVSYLGEFMHTIQKPRRNCQEDTAAFCVTSDEEMAKCHDLSKAAYVRGLRPEIRCRKAASKAACMVSVEVEGSSDMVVLDGGDVYKAGRYFKLQPIASELYNNSDAMYYAVAVIRSVSDVTNASQLRGLRSCHTGMGRTAGWVMPVGFLISQGLLAPSDSCSHTSGLADFFSGGSCVPGANDAKYNPGRVRSEDLCRRCVGDEYGENRCSRDSKERFSGYAGALRCLAEGKGDIAFVKHSTVPGYTDGRSHLQWAKDLISSDFKLLCGKGGTGNISTYEECNLGKVPAHQVVVRRI
ncbi:hypothetical protein JTE90_015522 [Oedothorax gibbosus]|uniref:Transferrin-like domain-containing protein n=1 Tax=Oedothorax gibbosus TaxID=931172 RepID=A0AAV6TRL2_9ARAC|nr:hypothetical protein JTE90_015522 [Oedothorax gibbosus]